METEQILKPTESISSTPSGVPSEEGKKKSENKPSSSAKEEKIENKDIKKEVPKEEHKKQEIAPSSVPSAEGKKPIGIKKTQAVVNGQNLPISTKHAVAICNMIRGKDIDQAISMLEQVEQMKKPVPMKGEIPHRKGKIMSGRYPINASKELIKLLKSLKSNAVNNELELEKYVLFCVPNVAPRPRRRFGRTRFKRTHVTLKLIQPIKKVKKKVNNKKSISPQNKNDKQEAPKININNKDKEK
jgi:large subunit ribosomal protein L22